LMIADRDDRLGHQAKALLVDPVLLLRELAEHGREAPRDAAAGEVDPLGGREERDLADLLQVHPDGVVRGCLQEIHVELALGGPVDLVAGDLDDLDPLAAKVLLDLGQELLDLFGREVVDGNRFEQVIRGHEAALTPAGGDLFLRFLQTQVAGYFGQCSRSIHSRWETSGSVRDVNARAPRGQERGAGSFVYAASCPRSRKRRSSPSAAISRWNISSYRGSVTGFIFCSSRRSAALRRRRRNSWSLTQTSSAYAGCRSPSSGSSANAVSAWTSSSSPPSASEPLTLPSVSRSRCSSSRCRVVRKCSSVRRGAIRPNASASRARILSISRSTFSCAEARLTTSRTSTGRPESRWSIARTTDPSDTPASSASRCAYSLCRTGSPSRSSSGTAAATAALWPSIVERS